MSGFGGVAVGSGGSGAGWRWDLLHRRVQQHPGARQSQHPRSHGAADHQRGQGAFCSQLIIFYFFIVCQSLWGVYSCNIHPSITQRFILSFAHRFFCSQHFRIKEERRSFICPHFDVAVVSVNIVWVFGEDWFTALYNLFILVLIGRSKVCLDTLYSDVFIKQFV